MHAEKEKLFKMGLVVTSRFLDMNCIPRPTVTEGRIRLAQNEWQATGLYVDGKIFVDLTRTIAPQRVRGRIWSWPRFRTDKTAAGVLAHETAHYVEDHFRRGKDFMIGPGTLAGFRVNVAVEPAITSYEPTIGEAFAEAGRLFILNPDLLRAGRPRRYEFFAGDLGLNPSTKEPWGEVLKDAPAHILQAAEKFIKLGIKK